ncbi:DeoR/GlpR transcriptional regulator [Hanamia caeni]|jgi:DeoR/GlpR family transcriptional regulator of sugar metabolism|uniref:DeoR/GlpR transcriptional regulator n=1 Tax=Hanamia caeni TaxID=2294116 RepID=A0A3M9N737_9BACT|nr:DeoR/GlpR family DNA-binding transcription regulator [Hanamia caeni]RNI33624.1 DeoR/GlpR transcriptional regulator [Hanamia caeni]
MLKIERQSFILHQVNLHNKVLSTDLSKQMKVSDDTIRRDIQQLADDGKVIKFHGGALSPSFHNNHSSSKDVYAYTQKKIIAQKAISIIKDGMFVLTTGGTTIIEMARALPPELHATFISGSIPALAEYIVHPNIEVIAIGDKISKDSKITVGSDAISRIKELKVDLCILGISAINLETGVSDNDWEVVQIKKAMIAASQKVACLTISEKINSRQPFQVCEINKIDTIVTELSAEDALLAPYKSVGIKVL